jgi:sodium/bile acid cotransporter 7
MILPLLLIPGLALARPGDDAAKRKQVAEMYRGYVKKDLRGVPALSVKQTLALLRSKKGKVVLLDVREPREQRVSMIAGAVPAASYLKQPERYRGKTVVAYCTIGHRSGMLVKKLRKQGVEAFNLAGSLLSWVHAGQPLVHKGKRTRRLHVYDKPWDLAPAAIETVW